MTRSDQVPDAVLERNVETLLDSSYDPPRLDDAARARIRGRLIAAHGKTRRAATPLYAIGFGLAAAAGIAIVAGAVMHRRAATTAVHRNGQEVALADGSTVLLDQGATVDVIGPRRVRVTGAALLDVTPGKGRFVVETAQGRVAVLGTRFVLAADSRRTTAAVIRGSVELQTDKGEVLLHAGEQGVAEPGQPPTRGPAPRLSHLASWAKDARARTEGALDQAVRNGTLFARDPSFRTHPPYPDSEFPLPLAQLTVDAVVDHQVARVALDQTFENPQTQDLEGVYRFAIPPDAALQRFAMYVDGKLTESAVVERMRARRIYEELVYHRVDPGLLEWAGAGRLSLRVYPIKAQSDKRIMLAYTQSLPRLYDDWTITVPLPEVDGTVDDVKFNVRVKGCGGCELHSPSHKVEVSHDGDDAIVSYHASGEKIGDSLVLIARDPRKQTQVATARDADHGYLVVRARPDLSGGDHGVAEHRARSWVIVDDVSASRGALERRAQADVIERLLGELDEDDRVEVITADVAVKEQGKLTRVDDVDRKAVRAFVTADDVGGVGATDLGVAFDKATAILAGVDPRDAYVLYLGDGVVTGGERGLGALRTKLAGKAIFVGVGIGDGVDTPTLAALADATGGSVYPIDLADDLAWRTFDLVASLYTSRVTGLSASLLDGRGGVIAGEAYLRAGQLGDGEELELVARVPAGTEVASVALTGQRAGARWSTSIRLDDAARSEGGYLPRLWAQRHVAALLLAKEDDVVVPPCVTGHPCLTEDEVRSKHREDIRLQVVDLGKKFFLLSRHTSLLVLENDAMYAQYGVTKGAGDTWAPYALPPTVAVKHVAAVTTSAPGVDPTASLWRTPIQRFYEYPVDYRSTMRTRGLQLEEGGEILDATRRMGGLGFGPVPVVAPMGGAKADRHASFLTDAIEEKSEMGREDDDADRKHLDQPDDVTTVAATASPRAAADPSAPQEVMKYAARKSMDEASITTGMVAERQATWMVGAGTIGTGQFGTVGHGAGGGGVGGGRGGFQGNKGYGWGGGSQPYPTAFNAPNDPRLDDLTELVPALFSDPVDDAAAELVAAGGTGTGSVDAAARALIQRARKALPSGTYKLGDGPSINVDGTTVSWRSVDDDQLEELSRFDGTTWRRAYPELGLEVVRALGAKSPALLLTYLPVLVPDADQLATWFTVTTQGAHTLVLTPAGDVRRGPLMTIELDDHDRVIAIKTGSGTVLLAVTWGAQGPTTAKMGGVEIPVGFTTTVDPIALPGDLVAVSLPLDQPAAARDHLAALPVGGAAWRTAQRQLLASLAALGDVSGQWQAYDALLGHGGVSLGDLVLAGRGVATINDADFARGVAPFGADDLTRPAVVRYFAAARAYDKRPRPEILAPAVTTGLVGAVWQHRHVLALITANQREAAVAALEAMGDRAPDLRVIAASVIGQHYDWPSALLGRAWDSVARGELRNVARYEAARVVSSHGDYAGAADRFSALLAEIDLHAAPVHLDYTVQSTMQSSPRGMAGFEMAWRGFVSRVLADGGVDHVAALAGSAAQLGRTEDVDRAIGRLAELAGTDRGDLIDVIQLAVGLGQTERAAALLPAVLAGDPDPTVERLAAELALAQGRPGEAADHLERAMGAESGPAPLTAVRADFGELVALRGRVAQLAVGPAKDQAIAGVLALSRRWREIDPSNAEIDRSVGELLLDLDRPDEAWRQLSTAIERDPMDGGGWIMVADMLERHGRYDQALATWQQAIVIDQTNPGPRLRKAQLFYALGRPEDGDAIVRDIVGKKWHDRFSNEAYQIQALAQQRKLLPVRSARTR